jgi:uncharacterized delta-60 repeat protein
LILSGNERVGFAQSGFEGDYDPGFGTNGYTVDPQSPDPARSDQVNTNFMTGDMMSDGSLVAGGYLQQLPESYDRVFYIKKFTPSGALDTSFNGGKGFIIPDFYVLDTNPRSASGLAGTAEAEENLVVRAKDSYIAKLKVLPDNKILVVGVCEMSGKTQFSTHGATDSPIIGPGVCMMRFNPDGTLDTTFGTAGDFTFAHRDYPNNSFHYGEVQGIVWTPIGNQPFLRYPGETSNLDLVIQPDGKILIVGETRTRLQPHIDIQVPSGFLLRYTSQGALDTGFGQNGAIHYHGNPDQFGECTPRRRFFGVAVQPDGRILALGSDGTVDTGDCYNRHGNRFVVTRWTASGQLETSRYLDNNTAFFNYQRERAMAAVFTAGGSKVIVSGSYGCKYTLVKLNVSNLSLDTTFGTGGIAGYSEGCNTSTGLYGNTLNVKSIQPDGKILGLENPLGPGRLTRFNPDGSADLSFGNENVENAGQPGTGSLYVNVLHFNGLTNRLHPLQLLVRPNGRINLFGYSNTYGISRAVVSQQNTELPSYTLSGHVLNGSGAGVAGVTLKLTGSLSATRTTDASGNYSFADLPMGGNFTVTPSKAGLSFVPASKSFTNLSADQLTVNFAVPSLSVNNITVTEGNTSAINATFTVKLTPAVTVPVTVKYATANSTALAPGDYTALALTQLTFDPGQTSKTVAVQVKGDTLDEANETFRLLLSAPTNAVISDNEGVCIITDNDLPPALRVNNLMVTEGNAATTVNFTISLSAQSAQTVTVKYQTSNGTATAPADYTAKALTTLTFTPFQTSKTVAVTIAGDLLDEAVENFKLQLLSPTNATIAVGTGTCTINDNDPPPAITINNATVTEPDTGTRALIFTVKLSVASGQTVTVKYATANGTTNPATAGTDYTAVALTTLTFLPGQTSKTVTVQAKGDLMKELNETFFVNLSGAVNASIADAQGLGTIVNDD